MSTATLAATGATGAPEWLTTQLGGDATMAVSNENAYAFPIPTMPTEDLRKFTFGNRIFNTNWVTAPASVAALDGLGPVFNRVSCSGCHTRDGRGRPPEHEADSLESMLIRISIPGEGEHGGVKPV
ncbi:MAG: di-heme oxidoredictase family protein, partial [Steroidobacterales bacterium]